MAVVTQKTLDRNYYVGTTAVALLCLTMIVGPFVTTFVTSSGQDPDGIGAVIVSLRWIFAALGVSGLVLLAWNPIIMAWWYRRQARAWAMPKKRSSR